jgi:hypothetical protein
MSVSDSIWQAEEEIQKYLATDNEKPGDPIRDAIDNLLLHMEAVRHLPGLDVPPDNARAAIELVAIRKRWGPPIDGAQAGFPRASLDELLKRR